MRLDLKTYDLSVGNFESGEDAFVLSSIMVLSLLVNSVYFLCDKKIGALTTLMACTIIKLVTVINKLDEEE